MTSCNAYAADTVLHIVNTWWQCAANVMSALVTGITKTHNLCFQESEALQAVFASHLCPNVLKAPARFVPQYSVIKFEPVHLTTDSCTYNKKAHPCDLIGP